MDLEQQHANMVAALIKPGQDILDTLNPWKARMIHAAMGIAGEVGELLTAYDAENFLEEAGDTLFFCRELRDQAELRRGVAAAGDIHLPYQAGEIVDVVKRLTIYNKPYSDELKRRLAKAVDAVEVWIELHLELRSSSRAQALEHNLHKLLKGPAARYASGSYSDAQASARADKLPEDRNAALQHVWHRVGLVSLFDSLSLDEVLASDNAVVEAVLAHTADSDSFTSVRELLHRCSDLLNLNPQIIDTAYPA